MPPASPAATSVDRIASSSDVLPWSTWPMIVTTGGRETRAPRSSGASNNPSSTSDSATRVLPLGGTERQSGAALFGTGTRWLGSLGRPRRAGAASRGSRGIVVLGFDCGRPRSRHPRQLGQFGLRFFLAEPLLGDLLGL